jgi:hypothetical protein
MGHLDLHFHGICTHFLDMNEAGPPLHRVVLLECDDRHAPLLSVPRDTTVTKTGDAACECIREVALDDEDRHFQLDGAHLKLVDAHGPLTRDGLWDCGVPRLTRMFPDLGPIDPAKAKQWPPILVAAWFDLEHGLLGPYVSQKEAVAVRAEVHFREDRARIAAECWHCPGVTWTFEVPNGAHVRVSNDCGVAGDPTDFLLHYRIAKVTPLDPPTLDRLPDCLPKPPNWADAPPGMGNASLGCSNSDYP